MRGVLTLAGAGTRMLPWSRGVRKEFLPLYAPSVDGRPVFKPVAHHVLENLVDAGITDITLVVNPRDLGAIREYFTIDRAFLRRHADHRDRLRETEQFYRTLGRLKIRYAIQPVPRGFGDAVLRAERSVGGEPFLLHAADAVLLETTRGGVVGRMRSRREAEDLDAVLLVRRVADPRRYGVVEGRPVGRWEGMRRLEVTAMEEKPARPRSQWAATAVYAFSPRVFAALRRAGREKTGGELEVTDAIREFLSAQGRVEALVLSPRWGEWCSVGSPEGFVRALRRTHRRAHVPSNESGGRRRAKD